MAHTTFSDGVTLTAAAWFQDADTVTYTLFGNGSSYTGALTLGSGGNIAVNTNKFTVAASTGNTLVAGTLSVTGHVTLEAITSTGATGTGKLVFDTTPTLVTPVLGVATATSINKVAVTAPASSATIAVADGKTLSYDDGTFTATLTGCTTAPTYTVKYTKIGNQVTLVVAQSLTIAGTSNAVTKTLTGMPAALYPAATTNFFNSTVDNGGSSTAAVGQISSAGVISFFKDLAGTAFTSSGSFQAASFCLAYVLG